MKKGISLLCIFTVVFLSGCSFFEYNPETKIDGFTKKIKNQVFDKYELTIPDSAGFLDGYISKGLDPSINLLFTIPKDDFNQIIEKNWDVYISEEEARENKQEITNMANFDVEEIIFINQYKHKKKYCTYLTVSSEIDGIVTVEFLGVL